MSNLQTAPWVPPTPKDEQQPSALKLHAKQHLAARDLFKSYQKGPVGIPVLQGINMSVYEGEFLSIVGQSGCGKSTLLHLLGTLDQPDAGEVHFDGHRIDNLPSRSRDLLRNRHFGMIFQFYHLMPELTTLQNVLAPALIAESTFGYWRRRSAHKQRAMELLELVGLADRAKHKPRELSGGEMQRAALPARCCSSPRCCWPTNRRATSIGALASRLWPCCVS